MKIGIITFHRAINYGAALQAYALQYALNQMGYEAEIIDYACEYLERCYANFYNPHKNAKGIVSGCLYYPIRSARKKKFTNFRLGYMHLSAEREIKREELKKIVEKYDYIITGSDQVWNPEQTNYDMSYFLDFVPSNKRISYAASMGSNNMLEQKEIFLNFVKNFKNISVREKKYGDKLAKILDREVYTVVDPVFLIGKTNWIKLIGDQRLVKEEYIFVYCLHEKACYEYAESLAKRTGKKIVCIPDSLKAKCHGKKDFKAGVFEFLNYILFADYIITDSFHATAFSIIFEKQFNVVMKQELKTLNGRLEEIAKKYGLERNVIQNENNVNRLGNIIDYHEINENVKQEVQNSIDFIKKSLG